MTGPIKNWQSVSNESGELSWSWWAQFFCGSIVVLGYPDREICNNMIQNTREMKETRRRGMIENGEILDRYVFPI